MRTSTSVPPRRTSERRHQVEHDVVVVSGVERDAVSAPAADHAADDVERAVAVERRDLDRHDLFDLGETAPEIRRQWNAADGGLQVEADERHDAGNGAAMRDQFVLARAFHGGKAESPAW